MACVRNVKNKKISREIYTVGSTLHPMIDDHYVEWIELIADSKAYRQFLNPGDEPIAEFIINAGKVKAREYCNKHGL